MLKVPRFLEDEEFLPSHDEIQIHRGLSARRLESPVQLESPLLAVQDRLRKAIQFNTPQTKRPQQREESKLIQISSQKQQRRIQSAKAQLRIIQKINFTTSEELKQRDCSVEDRNFNLSNVDKTRCSSLHLPHISNKLKGLNCGCQVNMNELVENITKVQKFSGLKEPGQEMLIRIQRNKLIKAHCHKCKKPLSYSSLLLVYQHVGKKPVVRAHYMQYEKMAKQQIQANPLQEKKQDPSAQIMQCCRSKLTFEALRQELDQYFKGWQLDGVFRYHPEYQVKMWPFCPFCLKTIIEVNVLSRILQISEKVLANQLDNYRYCQDRKCFDCRKPAAYGYKMVEVKPMKGFIHVRCKNRICDHYNYEVALHKFQIEEMFDFTKKERIIIVDRENSLIIRPFCQQCNAYLDPLALSKLSNFRFLPSEFPRDSFMQNIRSRNGSKNSPARMASFNREVGTLVNRFQNISKHFSTKNLQMPEKEINSIQKKIGVLNLQASPIKSQKQLMTPPSGRAQASYRLMKMNTAEKQKNNRKQTEITRNFLRGREERKEHQEVRLRQVQDKSYSPAFNEINGQTGKQNLRSKKLLDRWIQESKYGKKGMRNQPVQREQLSSRRPTTSLQSQNEEGQDYISVNSYQAKTKPVQFKKKEWKY